MAAQFFLDLFNRSLYNNANVCVLGGSGSGKTYLIQLIAMRYRKKRMPTYVIAPLKGFEWKRACLELGGTFIELSETSSSHINIMDVRVRDTSADAMIDSVTENKSAMLAKISVLKTFFSLLTSNLSPAEQDDLEGELDIALTKVYRKYGITEDNDSLFDENGNYKEMPILGDVYEECQKDDYECMSPLLKQLKSLSMVLIKDLIIVPMLIWTICISCLMFPRSELKKFTANSYVHCNGILCGVKLRRIVHRIKSYCLTKFGS